MSPIRLLHVFPSFETGGAQVRTVALINALGAAYRHSVLAINGDFSAARRVDSAAAYRQIDPFPKTGTIATARRFAQSLRQVRPDLLLTYNWGAIEAVIGNILSPVCPLVHVEDGFGADEVAGLKARRVWTRRILLRRAYCVAVPSRTLQRIAIEKYLLPQRMVRFIPNGIDTTRFVPGPNSALRASLGLSADDFIIGTVGRLRPEKDLPALVRRVSQAAIPRARLVFVGDGPERASIEAAATQIGISHRCVFTGEVADPAPLYGVFDLFAMTSITEQMPVGLLEAMSCGLPVLCTAAGDTASILDGSPEVQVLAHDDEDSFVGLLRTLSGHPARRELCGGWNRCRVTAEYSQDSMVGRWDRLYREAANMSPVPAGEH